MLGVSCLSFQSTFLHLTWVLCNLCPSECHETSVFLVVSNSNPEQRLFKTQHHTFCSFKKIFFNDVYAAVACLYSCSPQSQFKKSGWCWIMANFCVGKMILVLIWVFIKCIYWNNFLTCRKKLFSEVFAASILGVGCNNSVCEEEKIFSCGKRKQGLRIYSYSELCFS